MWIPKFVLKKLEDDIEVLRKEASDWRADFAATAAKVQRLETENTYLKTHLDWFKLRLNSVEKERAQLIFAACGQKISVPEFVPTYDAPETALAEQPDFAAVGEDARSDADYSMMPERTNN